MSPSVEFLDAIYGDHPAPEGAKAIDWVQLAAPAMLAALREILASEYSTNDSKIIAANAISKAEGK